MILQTTTKNKEKAMSGFISKIKSLFVSQKQPTPREMAEAQIRVIEQAIMEYNSKDRSLHRDKENAIRDGREADAKLREKQRELDNLPMDDDSFTRDELSSAVAELKREVEKARSKMDLADGNIHDNRLLLEGAEKTLLRLRGALEAGVPPMQLLQMVKDVAAMGNRYDLAVNEVGGEISGLFGSAAEEAGRNRKEALAESEERRRKALHAAQASGGTQSAVANDRSSRSTPASQV